MLASLQELGHGQLRGRLETQRRQVGAAVQQHRGQVPVRLLETAELELGSAEQQLEQGQQATLAGNGRGQVRQHAHRVVDGVRQTPVAEPRPHQPPAGTLEPVVRSVAGVAVRVEQVQPEPGPGHVAGEPALEGHGEPAAGFARHGAAVQVHEGPELPGLAGEHQADPALGQHAGRRLVGTDPEQASQRSGRHTLGEVEGDGASYGVPGARDLRAAREQPSDGPPRPGAGAPGSRARRGRRAPTVQRPPGRGAA